MVSKVILGDLALYSGDDCLRYSNDLIGTTHNEQILTDFDVSITTLVGDVTGVNALLGDTTSTSSTMFQLSNEVRFRFSDGTTSSDIPVTVQNNETFTYRCTYNGATLTTYLDGVEIGTEAFSGKSMVFNSIGYAYGGTQFPSNLQVKAYSLKRFSGDSVIEYDMLGQFGNTSLLDSSGNSNDGTINNAQWWKKGVDENYPDPDTFKATLKLPVEIGDPDYEVTYTDATPYYPTADAYWNPWNDGTIYFNVSQQTTGTKGYLNINTSKNRIKSLNLNPTTGTCESMTIGTIKGFTM